MKDVAKIIQENAERARAGGTPDFLNRWLDMTPEQFADNEKTRARLRRSIREPERQIKPPRDARRAHAMLPQHIEPAGRELLKEIEKATAAKQKERLNKLKERKMTATTQAKKKIGPKEAAIAAKREDVTAISWREMTGADLADDKKLAKAAKDSGALALMPTKKKPHPADLADLALIEQAKHYMTKLFHDGEFEIVDGIETLDAARERGKSMETTHKSTRRAMIYAILPDGRAVLVPSSYKATKQETTVKTTTKTNAEKTPAKPAEKPASAPRKTSDVTASPARKPVVRKGSDRSTYDWEAAEAKSKTGVLPNPPDFSASTHRGYKKRFDMLVAAARAGDIKTLKADETKAASPSRKILCRYRDLAIVALKAKA